VPIESVIEIALAATAGFLLFFSPPLQTLLGQASKPDLTLPSVFSDRWRDSDTARPRTA
jgi:hypothetical protein